MKVSQAKIIHDLCEYRFVFSRNGEVFIFLNSLLDYYSSKLCTYMRIERRFNKYVVVNNIWEFDIDVYSGSKLDCMEYIVSYFKPYIKINRLYIVTHE